MIDNKKFSAPSTSKQTEFEEKYIYDVEKFVDSVVMKKETNLESTNKDKFIFCNQ